MVLIKLSHLTCLLSFIQFSHCRRRIKGAEVDNNKVYAVYMVRVSPKINKDWLCGGAIVTEWYIVTSAACVQNLKYTYVIAGYKKFVTANDLENDECTKRKKKKIVFSCVPKSYDFDHEKIEKWTHIDIAVVKVDSKYDFKDKSYLQYCSYIPGPIYINFDGKYQQPGTDTIALGWGHHESFMFKVPDTKNYNQEYLKYAPLLVVHKSVCKEAYSYNDSLLNIDKYMICAQGVGNLDHVGDIINKDVPKVVGCVTKDQKLKGLRAISCEVVDTDYVDPYDEVYKTNDYGNDKITIKDLPKTDNSAKAERNDESVNKEKRLLGLRTIEPETNQNRKPGLVWRPTKKTTNKLNSKMTNDNNWSTNEPLREADYENNYDNHQSGNEEKTDDKNKSDDKHTSARTRKSFNSSNVGICQNDHGGPLVTWVGTRETLIGVITAFIVTSKSKCKGPYLFTSTQCNSAFLDCVINYPMKNDSRRKLCESPNEIGFEIKRRYISWDDPSSGEAENRMIEGRQQISIQQYNSGNQKTNS